MKETRLAARALAEAWPVPASLRGPIIDRLARIVTDPNATPREAAAAARAILAASRINVDVVGAAIKAREHEELTAEVAELRRRIESVTPLDRTP